MVKDVVLWKKIRLFFCHQLFSDLEMYVLFSPFGRIAPRGASARIDTESFGSIDHNGYQFYPIFSMFRLKKITKSPNLVSFLLLMIVEYVVHFIAMWRRIDD